MEKKNSEKLESILNNISEEFPQISLKNTIHFEEFIKNTALDDEIIQELSIFLVEYDKKSIDNNTKYGFPENDFEDYKDRDLFLCKSYKLIIDKLEENNKDEELIKKCVKLGAQKVYDRKSPYRCLTLGRLDYKETSSEFKELMPYYQEKMKKYDKGYRYSESENTKAFKNSQKTKTENAIKLIIVIVLVLIVFIIGRFVGKWATKVFTGEKSQEEVQEERIIETI